jgi:FkbH-like protein
MSELTLSALPWLLAAPADFNERCKDISVGAAPSEDVKVLAGYALTINQANRLYRTAAKLEGAAAAAVTSGLPSLKLAVLSNSTTELMIPSIWSSALRHGICLEVITTDFGQVSQEVFDPGSHLNNSDVDIVLLALDHRALSFSANTLTTAAAGSSAKTALSYIEELRTAIRSNTGASCIVQTLAAPPYNLLGSIDAQISGLLLGEIMRFNAGLVAQIADLACSDILFDVSSLANSVGTGNWFDERQWYMSRLPMANSFISLYADRLTTILGAVRGKSKKCLVLDLDNTVWGGVIGDDGLSGIVIGQGSARGESHLALQQLALELKNHGVVLAVCSKNDEKNALQPFREHPDMLLKENDIAVFIANWEDKATNLRRIANTLNLGLDSLVFVDDNPAERELVRMLLPEVAVPELPKDAALYPRIVASANYFEVVSFTGEDKLRATQYEQNAKRGLLSGSAGNIEEFLESLDMEMTIAPFDELGRKRIAQLVNKTNQFNLTTRRYTELDIKTLEENPAVLTLQVRLQDKFGDNGMISVVVCEQKNDSWEVDLWLMSCRVIKRHVEYAICDTLVNIALSTGISSIKGAYIPSEKNHLVSNLYEQLGFTPVEAGDETNWVLDTKAYRPHNPSIRISRNGL